jgi:CheY-like chemotaxis protein
MEKDLVRNENTSEPKLVPPKRLHGLRILSVDDSPDNRMLMNIFLTREEATVDEASDGQEAVQKAMTNHYDIVLMDIQMPGMNGYEALSSLLEKKYTKPIIALTAHAMHEEKIRTQAAGFCDHITKPIDKDKLISSILKNARAFQ